MFPPILNDLQLDNSTGPLGQQDHEEDEVMLTSTLWCVLNSLFDPRQCFRYRLHPGHLNMIEGHDISPREFRNVFHMYAETFDYICNWLMNDPSGNEHNEYRNFFGSSFDERYHPFRTAVACGIISLTQAGPYGILADLMYMPATTFRQYAEMFCRELTRRSKEWIFLPHPNKQKLLPGSKRYGPLNGAIFAIGISLIIEVKCRWYAYLQGERRQDYGMLWFQKKADD